jgi:hypothetical protein
MQEYNHTDAELAYWLEKYLIYRGTRSMMALITKGRGGLPQLMAAAASQDLIGSTKFLHKKYQSTLSPSSTFTAPSVRVK